MSIRRPSHYDMAKVINAAKNWFKDIKTYQFYDAFSKYTNPYEKKLKRGTQSRNIELSCSIHKACIQHFMTDR